MGATNASMKCTCVDECVCICVCICSYYVLAVPCLLMCVYQCVCNSSTPAPSLPTPFPSPLRPSPFSFPPISHSSQAQSSARACTFVLRGCLEALGAQKSEPLRRSASSRCERWLATSTKSTRRLRWPTLGGPFKYTHANVHA